MDFREKERKDSARPRRSVVSSPEERISMMQHVGAKLAKRKQLFRKRKVRSDVCLLLAMSGIFLMVVNIEFCIFHIGYFKNYKSLVTFIIKLLISFTTLLLLITLVLYHAVDIQIFMIDNGMEDWRLAISLSRILIVGLELFTCLLHPFPGSHRFKMVTFSHTDSTDLTKLEVDIVPVDVLLSLPMFLRFFLVCRVLLLHSQLFQDASAQSLGALNRIQFNFAFIFKSLMNLYAEYVLTILITFLFVWASWAIRICEAYHGKNRINYFDSMWIIAITFLTVGYGDLVPQSVCGKGIAVITGTFGVGCTALVVAVLARKLELSRAEMYVHNFVIGVELSKQMKHEAANVVKEGWLVHKYKRLNCKEKSLKHERRLLQAIRRIRELKNDQRKVGDNTLSMVEINRNQTAMQRSLDATQAMVQEIYNELFNRQSIPDS